MDSAPSNPRSAAPSGAPASAARSGKEVGVGCVVEPIKRQLIEQPALAQHLLEIRADLDRARHVGEQEQRRRLFYRMLNEEQAAE